MRTKLIKRLMSVLLTVTLLCAVTVPVLASDYKDVAAGRWSEKYINDMAERGILTGYEDGTFKPTNSITIVETLAVLSRFYNLSDQVKSWIYEDYGAYVEKTVSSSLSWAYDELSVCLAAGIITKEELASVKLTSAIEKQLLSVFLVRTIQLEKTALSMSGVELEFSDAKDITEEYTGYVALLISLRIVTGNDSNNFLPRSGVTREVAAAMLSRSISYIEGLAITLSINDYKGMSKTEGIIYSASGGILRLRLFNGLIREYTIPSSAAVKVNGDAKTLTSQYSGCYALITENNGAITKVEITSDSTVTWVQGNLASVVSSYDTNYIYIKGLNGSENVKYNLNNNVKITQDGKTAAYSELKTPYYITLKLVSGIMSSLYSYNNSLDINGEITTLDFGTVVTLKVKDLDGAVLYFPLDISKLPAIKRGDTTISVDRLNVGNKVNIDIEAGAVKSITAEDTANSITGELLSITTTTDATKWVIEDKNDKSWTLTLDTNASVYSGSKAILLSAIAVGATVKVNVYDDTITEVYLVSAAASTSKVTGTVLAVDTSAKTVTVLISGKLIYINASSVVSIIKSSTGRSVGLSGINAEETIVAYGSYSNSANFNAVTIIVES